MFVIYEWASADHSAAVIDVQCSDSHLLIPEGYYHKTT